MSVVTGTRDFPLVSSGVTPLIMRWKLMSSSRSLVLVRAGSGRGRAGAGAAARGGGNGFPLAAADFCRSSSAFFSASSLALKPSSPPASGWKPPNFGSAASSSFFLLSRFLAMADSQSFRPRCRSARIALVTLFTPVRIPSA